MKTIFPRLPVSIFFTALGVGALALGGCAEKPELIGDETAIAHPDRIIVQLDWVAEPEHGGFYQAEALGYFEDEGLNVELIQGGPNAFVHQKIATGQAQFGQSDSTNTLLAIAEGLPLINIAAVFQHDPSVLMLHEGNPISRFEELEGETIMARPEWAFLAFLRQKYSIEFNVLPQNFGLAQFIADPGFIQQGFYIAEPFFIEREGITPKYLYAWDSGFDAYTVIIGNRDFVDRFPEATRAFLRAYIRGYRSYLTEDPKSAHDIMLRINPKATGEYLEYSRRMIISEELATGPDGNIDAIGQISRDRFATQINQLEDLDILKRGVVSVDQVMSGRYLRP